MGLPSLQELFLNCKTRLSFMNSAFNLYGILACFLLSLSGMQAQTLEDPEPHFILLGIAQDGGYPHIGCDRQCCSPARADDGMRRYVASAALVDPESGTWWLIDATPDIGAQLALFRDLTDGAYPMVPEGILLTHAHMGHYTGLMQLGVEALNTKSVAVYAMPRMATFLGTNGPWSQLVAYENIVLNTVVADSTVVLNERVSFIPISVPHRDEFSETVGFRLVTSAKSYLYLPDIDKWHKWDRNLEDELESVDVAFLDGTFYTQNELPYRNINTIPHPLVVETISQLSAYPSEVTSKVVFFHFNHTNPLLWIEAVRTKIEGEGFQAGQQGKRY